METRTLRLFFGLPLPAALRESLGQWRQGQPALEGFSKAEGLHVTLAFLGQRPAESLPGLEGLASAAASRHSALVLSTAALGTFSHGGATRLLWLGLRPSRSLAALAEDLRDRLRKTGETFDTKPFHPHVTLARFHQARPLSAFTEPPVQRFTADRLVLFESRPQGCYTELQGWPLPRV